jgi:hypothetical protein
LSGAVSEETLSLLLAALLTVAAWFMIRPHRAGPTDSRRTAAPWVPPLLQIRAAGLEAFADRSPAQRHCPLSAPRRSRV